MKTRQESDDPGAPERRYTPISAGAELRAEESEGDNLPKIHGVACPWDSLSVELWLDFETGKPVHERFERGAFDEVLVGEPDIVVLRDHDRMHLLGRTASGTAKVWESERGLEYEVSPPDNDDGRSLVTLVRRGDLFGSSFAFWPQTVEWSEEEERVVRTVRKVKELDDCSPVTRAAYPASSLSARSLSQMKAELDVWRRARRGHLTDADEDMLLLLEI